MNLRKLILTAALPAALALVGCGPSATTGGSTSKATDNKGNEVKVDESIKVNGPPGAPYGLKQGETKKLDFSLDRGKDLKADVQLSVEAPEKLKVDLPKSVPASGEGKFSVSITASDDTPVAEHPVKITAKTDKGSPATAEFKVKVDKK